VRTCSGRPGRWTMGVLLFFPHTVWEHTHREKEKRSLEVQRRLPPNPTRSAQQVPLCAVWSFRSLESTRANTGLAELAASPSKNLDPNTPLFGQEDPLDLSILLGGGKENNNDSLSKGD